MALLPAAEPSVSLTVEQNGVPIVEGQTVSGSVLVTVTVNAAIGQHVQLYSNMVVVPFVETGHAPDTAVWSRTATIDTSPWFDGENLISVHVHPHNQPGMVYATAFTVGTFKLVSDNAHPAPNGDRLLPTVQFETFGGRWNVNTNSIGAYLSGGAKVVDDSGTFTIDRSSSTASPVQMIAHLGESVLGRFRWNTLNPPFGDSELVNICSMRPFQTDVAINTTVVVFATDGAGRANYGYQDITIPALGASAATTLPAPILDAKIVGIRNGDTLRVQDSGSTPVWVEISNVRSGVVAFPQLTLWVANRAVKVTSIRTLVESLPPNVDSLVVEIPLPSVEIVKLQNARQGGEPSTAMPIWVDFNQGRSSNLPTSAHIHLSSIRTTSYPWTDAEPHLVIRAPWNGSGHWTGTSLTARYDRWGNIPADHQVQWQLDGGAWNLDDGDGQILLTGLVRGVHQFAMRLTAGDGSPLGIAVSTSFTVANAAPTAVADVYTAMVDTTLTVGAPGVLGNDTDPENDPLSATVVTAPLRGTLALAGNGSFVYQPAPGMSGFDRFVYRVSDGLGGERETEVRLGVKPTGSSGATIAGDWQMLGRNPAHTGWTAGLIGEVEPTLAWTYTFQSGTSGIIGIAVESGRAVITRSQGPIHVVALDVDSGAVSWEREFPAGDISEPSIGDGRVFVQRANHASDSQVIALEMSDGSTAWSQPYSDQWTACWGPVVADGKVWMRGGYYGGFLGYDTASGANLFSMSLPQWDSWTPAYQNGELYTWLQGTIRQHDPETGVITRSNFIDGASANQGNGFMNTMPVIEGGDILVRTENGKELIAVDRTTLIPRWRLSGSWGLTPVVASGTIYAPDSTGIAVVDQATGTMMAHIDLPKWPGWGPIVTDDVIIVGHGPLYYGPGTTVVIDRATLAIRMSIPAAGHMALAQNTLFISGGQAGPGQTGPSLRAYVFPAAANTAPTFAPIAATTAEDTSTAVTLIANDAESDPLTFSIVSSPLHGTASITGDVLTFVPNADWFGVTVMQVVANDGLLDSNPALVTITVTPVNDAPVITMAAMATPATVLLSGSTLVSVTASDIDGDFLTYAWTTISGPEQAQFGASDQAGGSVSFPVSGDYALEVTVSDGVVAITDSVTVTVVSDYEPGLQARFYTFATNLSTLPDVTAMTPAVSRIDAQINYPSTNSAWSGLTFTDRFSSLHTGLILIPETGTYTIYLNSDDGSRLWIDGQLLIDNNGLHGMVEKDATLSLTTGFHDLRVEYFENSGGAGLILSWAGPGISKQVIPSSAFAHLTDLPGNQPPSIITPAAASPSTIALSASSNLSVVAQDRDGDALTYAWNILSGPGTASFSASGSPFTAVQFSEAGDYTLEISVSDDQTTVTDIVTVSVIEDPVTPVEPGLQAGFYSFGTRLSTLPNMSGLIPTVARIDANINYPSTRDPWSGLSFKDYYSSLHTGLIQIQQDGDYTFYLSSDDGSRLWIDGQLVIDNNGLHGMVEKTATLSLTSGYHDLRVEFFENTGGAGLLFSWKIPGGIKSIVPASVLFHLLIPASNG